MILTVIKEACLFQKLVRIQQLCLLLLANNSMPYFQGFVNCFILIRQALVESGVSTIWYWDD